MEFHKYQHIMKLGTDEVDGILKGTVYLFYKIDGTNSQVFLKDDNTLGFGSRNKEINLTDDNADFVKETIKNSGEYKELLKVLENNPEYIIYGEWLVPHTLKTYKADSWKKFYVFDILDTKENRYLTYEEYFTLLKDCTHINIIPLIAKLENPTEEEIKNKLNDTGSFLCANGLGEGIVIKNYSFVNRFGRTTWAKMLTEDFLSTKKTTREHNREIKNNECEHATEQKIINKYLTFEHISKEYHKLCETYNEDKLDVSHTFELLNRVFEEFISDNIEIIIKKEHLPTINFKALKQLSDSKTKEAMKSL